MTKAKAKKKPDKRPQASAWEVLQSVPFRNESMSVTRGRDGGVLASIPMRRPRFLVPPLSWILPYSSHKRVSLDRMGAMVLDLCDGKRNVENIIEKFAADHKLTFRESQLLVMRFLQHLVQRGVAAVLRLQEDAKPT